MPKLVPNPPPGFDDMSVAEQIEYVQTLWERIAASPDDVPVPDWHREVIRERVKQLEADPAQGRPWAEVRRDIERKLPKSSSE